MMEEKVRESGAMKDKLREAAQESVAAYNDWSPSREQFPTIRWLTAMAELEAALAESGAGRMQNAVCFTCEGESGLPPSQTIDICQRCYGDELEWKTLPVLAQLATAEEKEVPMHEDH